jgi:uncharacterized protein (TIRG00374 family)
MRMERSRPVDHLIAGRLSRTSVVLIVFVCGILGLFFLSGWDKALAALSRVGAMNILFLCALAGAHYILRATRWHIMVLAGGVASGLSRNFQHYFGGFVMTATPGRVGELVRLRWLKRETGIGYARLLPIAFADRAIELAAMVLLIAGALAAASLGTTVAWWVLAAGGLIVWVTCSPTLLEMAAVGAWRLSGRRASRSFARLRRMARSLRGFMRPRVVIPTLALGIVGWALEGLAFWLLLSWLGAGVGFATATAIFLIAVLSGTLSGLPGGLGGTEAAVVALLLLQGVSTDTAIVATAIIRVTTLWLAVAIGFLVFPAAEMRSAPA